MGSRIAAWAMLVVVGVIIADIWTHPGGTKAAGNGLAAVLTPTYTALLGGTNSGGK